MSPFKINPFTSKFDEVSDLTGYVPYTGATTDVDLGTHTLGAGAITGESIALTSTDILLPNTIDASYTGSAAGLTLKGLTIDSTITNNSGDPDGTITGLEITATGTDTATSTGLIVTASGSEENYGIEVTGGAGDSGYAILAHGSVMLDGTTKITAYSAAFQSITGLTSLSMSGSLSASTIYYQENHSTKNADYIIQAAGDEHKTFKNTGATALITFSLPNNMLAGRAYKFMVTDADGIKIKCVNTSDVIFYDGTPTTADTGYLQSTTVGSTLTAERGENFIWFVTNHTGTWTVV